MIYHIHIKYHLICNLFRFTGWVHSWELSWLLWCTRYWITWVPTPWRPRLATRRSKKRKRTRPVKSSRFNAHTTHAHARNMLNSRRYTDTLGYSVSVLSPYTHTHTPHPPTYAHSITSFFRGFNMICVIKYFNQCNYLAFIVKPDHDLDAPIDIHMTGLSWKITCQFNCFLLATPKQSLAIIAVVAFSRVSESFVS